MLPEVLTTLIENLKLLPGVGEKTAQRYAISLIKQGNTKQKIFAQSLLDLEKNLHICPECFFYTETENTPCVFCQNHKRDENILCIVENVFDVLALEKTEGFFGKYHILQGLLSPIDNITPEKLTLSSLFKRIETKPFSEIIFALNPTLEGDATVHYIKERIPKTLKTTIIARGIPSGASIEYIDEITLKYALLSRK
jgi:recombination protein RecR